jgi:23S rRNA pseudouridine1911/1915/1917 synthase
MSVETNSKILPETQTLVVEPAESRLRLDVFLTHHLPGWSRSQIQKLIRSGKVQLGPRAAMKGGEEITAGEQILVQLQKEEPRAMPEELPLDIVYEDEDLVAVNKPAGMVVHVGAGVRRGTLVNALLYHIGRLSSTGGADRPGIVHRLDKNTSGLILIAKTDAAHRTLAAAFKGRAIRKIYIGLVHGAVENHEGVIQAPVGRDPFRRVRMATGGVGSREARTRYRVLRRFPNFTLLEVAPETGRTHQIRVHLASVGHPILGDTLYGAPARIRIMGHEQKTLSRTFLHAFRLGFKHPRSGEPMLLTANVPAELEEFLESLAPSREGTRAESAAY